jgi:hypothetical protein
MFGQQPWPGANSGFVGSPVNKKARRLIDNTGAADSTSVTFCDTSVT